MNKDAGKKIADARDAKGWSQTEMAEKLANELNQSYSLRQYQKIESGSFPKYKKEIIKAVDKLLSLQMYEVIYESNVHYKNKEDNESVEKFQTEEEQIDLIKPEDYRDKYYKLLEQQNKDLRQLFEVSLKDIATTQEILLAQLKAQIKRSAERFADNDPVKAGEELDRINIYVAEYFQGEKKRDSHQVGS